jgi:SAM-dependent methyltransferase
VSLIKEAVVNLSEDALSPYGRAFFDQQEGGSLRSAEVAIPLLVALVNVRSAVDVGCGVGTWLTVLMAHGVSDVLGIDGDYVDRQALHIPSGRFLPLDIRQPFALERRFDVALSLEVAEHLPAECAEGFIDSLVRLAPVILFSAAIPFQNGKHHVNEQWPEYWASIFKRHGYIPLDCLRPHLWNDPRVEWWYAQNILVYADEEGLSKNPSLATCREDRSQSQLSIVHPTKYLNVADPRLRGFKASMSFSVIPAKKAFLKGLKRVIRNFRSHTVP